MEIIDEITSIVNTLDEIDEYSSTLNGKLSELDSKEQDLLHYIENHKINILWCYRVVKEIKDVRTERRKVKNDMELISKFNEIKNRITSKENRQFVLTELHKKDKLLNMPYKNRQYSEEDIQKMLGGVKQMKEIGTVMNAKDSTWLEEQANIIQNEDLHPYKQLNNQNFIETKDHCLKWIHKLINELSADADHIRIMKDDSYDFELNNNG